VLPSIGLDELSVAAASVRDVFEAVFEAVVEAGAPSGWEPAPVDLADVPLGRFEDYFPGAPRAIDWADGLEAIVSEGPTPTTGLILSQVDPGRLDPHARVLYLQATRAHAAWSAALELRAVAAVAGHHAHRDEIDERSAVAEVRVAARLSPCAARNEVDLARILATRLPATLRALGDGSISRRHAEVIAELTGPLDDAAAGWVETQVLPRAAQATVAATRRATLLAVIAADPEAAAKRDEAAKLARRVELWRTSGGTEATVAAHGPAADIATIWAALNAEAHARRGADARPIAARRFDVLLRWATGMPAESSAQSSAQSSAPDLDDPAAEDTTGPGADDTAAHDTATHDTATHDTATHDTAPTTR
jgi:hypothetical protein